MHWILTLSGLDTKVSLKPHFSFLQSAEHFYPQRPFRQKLSVSVHSGSWMLLDILANFYRLVDGVQIAFRGTVMVNYTIVIVPQGSWLM